MDLPLRPAPPADRGPRARLSGLPAITSRVSRTRAAARAALRRAEQVSRALRSPEPEAEPEADEAVHRWPLGHFYSPVPDTRSLSSEPKRSRVWPAVAPEIAGVEWRPREQVTLVRELAAQPELELPRAPTGVVTEYQTDNDFFRLQDGWTLQAMLRHLQPKRLIEVGGGWSSLLSARVNRECLGGELDFTCIEPYPAPFLTAQLPGLTSLLAAPVEDVPLDRFLALEAGDVLFIDSSHVIKTGNDVRFLYHEVLPRLAPGVAVHVHDIFLPHDYPQQWVLEGWGWNEQYLLQSFLAFNPAYEVLVANHWLAQTQAQVLAKSIPGYASEPAPQGCSLWMRRVS